MVSGDAQSQNYWSILEHQTWSNNQSQHDFLYDCVSSSISLNLKLSLRNSEMANGGVSISLNWNCVYAYDRESRFKWEFVLEFHLINC